MSKLTKSSSDKVICGVCGGLAKQMGTDSTIIRLIWAIGTILTAGFLGVIIYFVCALIIPNE
ncbi:MAG: PspC domain-containing protein [Bacteroidales bacterium]|nr:PspC domain-containing protein [Bacteroidales bacterium]